MRFDDVDTHKQDANTPEGSCPGSDYVRFVLRKERWDTLGAIAELAEVPIALHV